MVLFQVKLFKEDSNFGKYLSRSGNRLKEHEDKIQVQFIWGLKPQELDKCHKTDVDCFGETVWDESFEMNTERAQTDLLVGRI